MRCASKVLSIILPYFDFQLVAPSWYSGRLWLIRLGFYKLHRPKMIADDWIWIVDHSVQLGQEKCLIILGIRACDLPRNRPLIYSDVEPIEMIPVKESNGEIVYKQLEATIKKTGIPREIISDAGPDLKAGVNIFLSQHPETCGIYDIKHKTAIILKHALADDEIWLSFTKCCTSTKKQVQQTELAFLAPPQQRSKARYMNIDTLIQWGVKALNFVETERAIPSKKLDQNRIQEKLGWIVEYKDKLNEWSETMAMVGIAESKIRNNGITKDSPSQLQAAFYQYESQNEFNLYPQANKIKHELLWFMKNESSKVKDNECLLGSSEIIESLFGKQKYLEAGQSNSGFTGLILSVGAFLSQTTTAVITDAMATVKTKTIHAWIKEKIGNTVQSCRKKFLNVGRENSNNTEQKKNQPEAA